jgi:ATP-binding cassette subfamily B protein/subfamily B ATP-binding cassette protein MsbA
MNRWSWRLLKHASAQRGQLALIVVLMFAVSAVEVVKPLPVKLIVDHALAGKSLSDGAAWITRLPGGGSAAGLIALLTAATVALFLAGWLANACLSYLQAGAGNRLTYALSAEVFEHLQGRSLCFHGKHPTGDLVRRLSNDAACIRELVIGVCAPVLGSLVTLTAMFCVMWRLDGALALCAIAVAPVMIVAIRALARPLADRAHREMELEGELAAGAERNLSAIQVVQAFGAEDRETARFGEVCEEAGRAHLRSIAAQIRFTAGTASITAIGTAIVMLVGGLHVVEGKISVGTLLAFLSYLAALYAPMEAIAFLSNSYATAAAGARRIFEVLQVTDGVRDQQGAHALPTHVRGHVVFRNLVFGYEPGRPVLNEVNLEVVPGESLALLGQSGAGKSTLMAMVLRFFDPWSGAVEIDGCDVRSIQLASLRANMAVVLQDSFLMPLTVGENIAYGRPQATREEIVSAARAANAHEFIERLPKGYDTLLDERGANLSGGQKQRLAIARAFLKDAPILILDEPSSALDADNEALLAEALERLRKGRTTIVIAHKLSTVRQCDRVAMMAEGRIVELGTQEELLSANGPYRRYHDLQFGAPAAAGTGR